MLLVTMFGKNEEEIIQQYLKLRSFCNIAIALEKFTGLKIIHIFLAY